MRATLATLLALIVASVPARAQEIPPSGVDGATEVRTPLFSLGGGPATPSGATSDALQNGFQVGATGVFPLTGRLGIEVGASYVRLGPDQDQTLLGLGIEPSSFTAGGGLLEGGYRWVGTVSAGVRLLLRPRVRRVVPHLSAGAGYALTGVAEQHLLYLGERETLDGVEGSLSPAVLLGAGVEVGVAEGIGIFVAARHLRVFTNPRVGAAAPFTIGVSLRLEAS